MDNHSASLRSVIRNQAVWISALGYFVDVYDLVLFGIVRVASLKGIGISDADLLGAGTQLLNWQMAGMLAGGFAWGLLGDRFGRMRALYGSILIYSLANLANGFATTLPLYALLRFLAGFGLAGELGAAVTLVSETVAKTARGTGAAVIGVAGFVGALAASLLGGLVTWQTSYIVGGLLGLVLLVARIRVGESPLFLQARAQKRPPSNPLWIIARSPVRMWRYFRCILVGIPIWFVSGILLYFSPELARELGIAAPVTAGQAIFWGYAGSILGDPVAGFLSQRLRSRKRGILFFIGLGILLIPTFFYALRGTDASLYYGFCFCVGFVNGYWTLFVALSSELFGTDVRATIATTAPNLVRAAVIPMTMTLMALKENVGTLQGVLWIGMTCLFAAGFALLSLPETFAEDLDYLELPTP